MSTLPQNQKRLDALAAFIKVQYGFKEVRWLKNAGGLSSLNWFIEADHQGFVLKKFRTQNPEKVLKIEKMTFFLHEHSLPVSIPLTSLNKKYSVVFEENLFALYPKAEGLVLHEPLLTTPVLDEVAKLLCNFHSLSPPTSILPQSLSPIKTIEEVILNFFRN